jgi:hypothetical protein
MLWAARVELESDMRVKVLILKARELDFFMNALRYIAQLSALIAGFAYSALVFATRYIDFDICEEAGPKSGERGEILCAEMHYPLALTITMGFSMYCMWGAMLMTLLAPVLALRGPQGSVQLCVQLLEQEYQCTLFLFAVSTVALIVSAVIWAMTMKMRTFVLMAGLIFCGALYCIFLTSKRALQRFAYRQGGRFGDPGPVRRPSGCGPPGGCADSGRTADGLSSAAPARATASSEPSSPMLRSPAASSPAVRSAQLYPPSPQLYPPTPQLLPAARRLASVAALAAGGAGLVGDCSCGAARRWPVADADCVHSSSGTPATAAKSARRGAEGAKSSRARIMPAVGETMAVTSAQTELTSPASMSDAEHQLLHDEMSASPVVRNALWRGISEPFLDLGRQPPAARPSFSDTGSPAPTPACSPANSRRSSADSARRSSADTRSSAASPLRWSGSSAWSPRRERGGACPDLM